MAPPVVGRDDSVGGGVRRVDGLAADEDEDDADEIGLLAEEAADGDGAIGEFLSADAGGGVVMDEDEDEGGRELRADAIGESAPAGLPSTDGGRATDAMALSRQWMNTQVTILVTLAVLGTCCFSSSSSVLPAASTARNENESGSHRPAGRRNGRSPVIKIRSHAEETMQFCC